MRFIVYGAGAIGGTIGGRLHEHGRDVTLIARGAHLDALRDRGLELRMPERTITLDVPAVGSPADADLEPADVVVLAMKTQDTRAALDDLAACAPPDIAVVCAQNGVDNERQAMRRFAHVYGMCVMLPAAHFDPGVVEASGTPRSGILDVGRFPAGADAVAAEVAATLDSSGFSARPDGAVMRQKYAKLLMNLGNALEAAAGSAARGSDLYRRARDEGEACLHAAGIDFATPEEDAARRADLMRMAPIGGRRRGGGSSWQSLARGAGSIESDYLNGEIVLLGRLFGVPTPVNEALQAVANRMAREGGAPGSMPLDAIEASVASVRLLGDLKHHS